MQRPVVHFEIVGEDAVALRAYYAALFGWEFDTSGPASPAVSEPGEYGFVDRMTTADGVGIPGGVCGGAGHNSQVLVYVGVPDVEEALAHAEQLGGRRQVGPLTVPGTDLTVGQFVDPAGNVVGLARAE